ncbi:alpha-mannosidase [Catelliglobosispora koreensis]|uniref:alpha-mannosidase n=1 Tax=Catelliglobosispora koreensis TaxID=129052 RepID=UPI000380E6D6|nr:glycoside hydrolase family 38 C-terminal domain-containing protein [Catelliglobosispora koreensis]
MHDDRASVEARLRRVLEERIRPAIYPQTVPLSVGMWAAPGEPVTVAQGLAAERVPVSVGDAWGAPWGTSWLTVSGEVPAHWAGKTVEALLDLGFNTHMPGFQCEGLVYLPDGTPVKGLHPKNQWVRIGAPVTGGEQVLLHVEAASNPIVLDFPLFRPTAMGDKETAGDAPQYRLAQMDLAVFDETVWNLVADLEVLGELMAELPADGARRWEIARAVERALDTLDLQAINATAAAAREQLAAVLASPAEPSAHRISAVGHAHIDSAWLWPLRETVRKVARTTANMTALLADEPDFVYTMSQAQQFAWIKEHRPEVYAKVKAAVAEGRFVPAGGMWVESDTNMPGSEAMARQFVHGKRFFLSEFGIDNEEAWLPDTFGFAAGLPQIIKAAGSKWLLTQKISWSQVNKFPHHTFLWEGIDGTRIFTHFPPVDTYNCAMLGRELAHAARNFKDKGRARHSIAPTGFGDGGGGTTREMIARAARLRDLEGSPMVRWESPAAFFTKAQAEYTNPPVWVGELFLELHRGTLTSQAKTKQGNRRCEHLLREAELWSATATVQKGLPYPYAQLDRLWKTVLLHQFHDILPGSSIAWVHREAEKTYAAVAAELNGIIDSALRALAGSPDGIEPTLGAHAGSPGGVEPALHAHAGARGGSVVFNAAPHERQGVAAGGGQPVAARSRGGVMDEHAAVVDGVRASRGIAADRACGACALVVLPDGGWRLSNGLLDITVDGRGLVASVFDVAAQRETIPAGSAANLLQLHQDFPNAWDAWDVDAFYRNTVVDLANVDSAEVVSDEPSQVSVRVTRSVGSSKVAQTVALTAGAKRLDFELEVDWREREKFLKVAFPLDVHSHQYAAETQFGHVFRATHTNTSWEAAKFEACNHRFVHVTEPGWGAAVVTDSTYGHDVTRTASTTTVRLSLLRAPRFPDPQTDQGVHRFRYALVPGAGIVDAVREGYRINLPERTVAGSAQVRPLASVDNDAVVISAVKLADDASGDVIVRLYEACGGRAAATLTVSFPVAGVQECDLLERPYPHREAGEGTRLRLRPFQMVTLRLSSVVEIDY